MKHPAYLNLLDSGEFEKRVLKLNNMLHECMLCPHECGVDRHAGNVGVCKAGELVDVSSLHKTFFDVFEVALGQDF